MEGRKNHFFFLHFTKILYLCNVFRILYPRCSQGLPKVYPRCSQGLPKVYPRCSQGVAKSKRLSYTWVVLGDYLDRVWVGRRNDVIGNSLNVAEINHIRIMARIKQVGIGRMASGTIDGITYVTRGNVTFARSTPTMPAHVYTTPAAKRRRAIICIAS